MKFSHFVSGSALAVAMLGSAAPLMAAPTLSPIWGEDAVVQRDWPIVVEGKGQPGEKITVQLGNQSASGNADKDGRFAITLPARPGSDAPLELKVSGTSGQGGAVSGLVMGDVWLCSGQSNMELTVDRALDAWSQVQSSKDDLLRMVTIPKAVHFEPKDQFGGPVSWQKSNPQNTPAFSAACYYMAKELRKKLSIPVGMINASWGGSASRPWITAEGGRAIYGADEMALLRLYSTDPVAAVAQYAPRWEGWYMRASGGQWVWGKPDSIDWSDAPNMEAWNNWKGTPLAENPVATVWLRRTITLTPAQAQSDAMLSLGAIDDMDMTWVNGKAVGNSYGWDSDRNYRVPASYLKAGPNEIIIAATNSWGGGGFTSGGDKFALTTGKGERIGLGSDWRYAIAPVTGFPPRSPWDRQAGIGVMHNAMVAPIGHYAASGVAWYQGESDVGTPGYAQRLKALFTGWRGQLGPQARMLVVQLANFGAAQTAPTESGWAELREEQRKGVNADSNAALVTAIDLGERGDIHPANKNELGRRLALAAMGEAAPQPVSAKREGDTVRVSFSGVNGALVAWSGASPLGFELCSDGQGSCRYAQARTDGSSVVLAGDGQPVTRIRYGWADSPTLNLYDARPLAVPGFELAVGG